MTDLEKTGNINERCTVDENICDANEDIYDAHEDICDSTTESDGYLSDFYVSTPKRAETLKKVKEKKKKFEAGCTKYYKPQPEEVVEIQFVEREILLSKTTEEWINLFASVKNVLHLETANYREVIKSKELLLVLFYSQYCQISRALLPEFLKAAYALKIRFGNRVALALCHSQGNRKVAKTYNCLFSSPHLLLYRNGKFCKNFDGNRTAEGLKSFMEKWYRHHYEEKKKTSKTQEEDD